VKSISHENIQQAGTVQHPNHFGDDFKFIGRYIQPVIECCNHLPSNILPRCPGKIGVRLQNGLWEKAQPTGEDDEHYQLPHHLSHSMRVCQTACREFLRIFAPYRIAPKESQMISVLQLSPSAQFISCLFKLSIAAPGRSTTQQDCLSQIVHLDLTGSHDAISEVNHLWPSELS
jgi:hypothetical protein